MGENISVTEQSSIKPTNIYSLTKYLGETVLSVSKTPSIIMRFPFLYGSLDDHSSIYNVIQNILNKKPVYIKSEQRDFIYIKDAVAAILLALNYKGNCKIFNVGSGTLVPMEEIAKLAMKYCGYKVKIHLQSSRKNIALNSVSAQKELGWKPTISLENGIENLIRLLS